MEHNQFEIKNNNPVKASPLIGPYGSQQEIAMDDDGGSTGGDLDILFVQDLSENILVDLNGGQRNASDDIKKDPVDDDSAGDGGGPGGGDWIPNHNQTLVSIEQ